MPPAARPAKPGRAGYYLAAAILALAVTLFYAFHKGQDVNWDQRNYHIAIPFLLLHGTYWSSIAPAGIQSWFNPLVLIPQYLAITHLPPIAATLVITLAQLPAYLICARICRQIAGPDHTLALLGFLLCLASPIALSEAGTTYVDLVTAIPVLGAYSLLLTPEQTGRRAATAGALIGLATGLKLTNAVFAFGTAALIWPATPRITDRLARLTVAGLGAATAFLIIAGWWHWLLWQHFGDPVFPYFARLFSPDAPVSIGRDARFGARSAFAPVTWPIYWLIGGSPNPGLLSPASEVDPRDARFAIVLLCMVPAVLTWHRRPRLVPAERALIAAWLIGYLVWIVVFANHRYMIPLELLAGCIILCFAKRLPRRRQQVTALAAACVITLIVLHVPQWNRAPWSSRWDTIAAQPVHLAGRPLVFLPDKPTAVIAASIVPAPRLVGLAEPFALAPGSHSPLARQLASGPKRARYSIVHPAQRAAGPGPAAVPATLRLANDRRLPAYAARAAQRSAVFTGPKHPRFLTPPASRAVKWGNPCRPPAAAPIRTSERERTCRALPMPHRRPARRLLPCLPVHPAPRNSSPAAPISSCRCAPGGSSRT